VVRDAEWGVAQGRLVCVLQATEPFQKFISLQVSKKVARQRKARELPPPLYILYCQIDALSDASEHSVSVDVIPAVRWAQTKQGSAKVSAVPSPTKSSRRSRGGDADDEPSRGSKRQRVNEAGVAAATSSGQGVSGSKSTPTSDAPSMSMEELFAPNPRAVRVRVRKLPDRAPSVNIIFQYLPKLDIVTAEVRALRSACVCCGAFTVKPAVCRPLFSGCGQNTPHQPLPG